MSQFNNDSILSWLHYFSQNTPINLSAVRLLDITGTEKSLMPVVQTSPSVLVFTDGNRPEVFYQMWDAGMGDCEIWYNEGSEPSGPMKHNLLSEMIDRGVNVSAAMLINNPRANSAYRTGLPNTSFSPGSIRYVAPEIRAVILNKLHLDQHETLCSISGESIAVEAAIAARRGKVVAVEYRPGDRQTMRENIQRFGLGNVLIVDDVESYSHRWPVPDAAFLVASPRLETEIASLVGVNPNIRVVVYTLEFSVAGRVSSLLAKNGVEPDEILQLTIARVGRKDTMEVQPAPWVISGRAGRREDEV